MTQSARLSIINFDRRLPKRASPRSLHPSCTENTMQGLAGLHCSCMAASAAVMPLPQIQDQTI